MTSQHKIIVLLERFGTPLDIVCHTFKEVIERCCRHGRADPEVSGSPGRVGG